MKFSIIVPCYNLEPWIRACLDSVVTQSFLDWECIVVDDESQDASPAICDKYAARDVRFRVVHQKNAGEGGARNAGLAVAQGEWVFFLDGDDVMIPGALERLVNVINTNPSANVIRFEFENFEDGGPHPKSRDRICRNGSLEGINYACERVVNVSHGIMREDFMVYVWQHIYRLDAVKGIVFKHYSRGCDRVYISDVLLNRVNEVVVIPDVLYGYRQRRGSAMNSVNHTPRVVRDRIDHRVDIVQMIAKSGKTFRYAGSLAFERYFYEEAVYSIAQNNGEERQALLEYWRQAIERLLSVEPNDFSFFGRSMFKCCLFLPFPIVSLLCVYIIPLPKKCRDEILRSMVRIRNLIIRR